MTDCLEAGYSILRKSVITIFFLYYGVLSFFLPADQLSMSSVLHHGNLGIVAIHNN